MSVSFRLLKQSKKSRARLGILKTPHGEVETPAFIPVATRASVRMLDTREIEALGSQMLISNTFHLHLTPGEKIVKKAGGVHGYMDWKKPVMTDSGGFQVFSFGFGRDHGVGKILKEEKEKSIETKQQPSQIKIGEDGVEFRSPINGDKLFLSPRESIKIQEAIGADIMFAFDECPSPLANEEYMKQSLEKTHRWAQMCLDAKKTKQGLYGIVQGGGFTHLRLESARIIGGMGFDGFGIGGEFGYDKKAMEKVVGAVTDALPKNLPRHLLGVGHPEDFAYTARAGIDTFDCIAPTHYARHGTAFTSKGKLDLKKAMMTQDFKPIDPKCSCPVCKTYTRSYISNLLRTHELTGMKLATMHNLYYFNALAKHIRKQIKNGEL
ncbi:tRNA guanosine(34) transglycosylase Tgt [bacterium]|nr:tRNA guanosine(34) transglycosylase Tgt [bacterium]